MRVLGISGSLRRGSYNTALLRHAGELLVAEGAVAAGPVVEPEPHPARTAPTVSVAIVAAILVATV